MTDWVVCVDTLVIFLCLTRDAFFGAIFRAPFLGPSVDDL
jgi:hypothetical protein